MTGDVDLAVAAVDWLKGVLADPARSSAQTWRMDITDTGGSAPVQGVETDVEGWTVRLTFARSLSVYGYGNYISSSVNPRVTLAVLDPAGDLRGAIWDGESLNGLYESATKAHAAQVAATSTAMARVLRAPQGVAGD